MVPRWIPWWTSSRRSGWPGLFGKFGSLVAISMTTKLPMETRWKFNLRTQAKLGNSLNIQPFPEPWQWSQWLVDLNTELRRVVAPHGQRVVEWLAKCQDPDVSDGSLQHSGESPRLDLMLAQELVRVADASCLELTTRTKRFREARMPEQTMVTRREMFSFYLRCFDASQHAGTTWQGLDLTRVKLGNGTLG